MNRFELSIDDAEYPPLLAQSPDPPKVLYGIGDPASLKPGLAVVGARKATPYGLAAARLFAGWAAGAGYSIVSGGAHGCDQAAHVAALDSRGATVAVMAGGPDMVYPKSSSTLLAQIARAGAVISEHPWGTEPRKWTFRTRNRIIAGLCPVLLVLEAALPSGTFTTADYAADAGRTIAAIPGSIFASECRGSNRLLRNGAFPLTDVSELADLLRMEIGDPVGESELGESGIAQPVQDIVLAAVLANPMRPDDLARALELDVITVARRLGALETAGRIAKYRDGRYGPG